MTTMSTPMKQLKVGVSIFVRKGEQSLWENGIFQNCLFLAQLLQRSPRVSEVFLVAGGGGGGEQAEPGEDAEPAAADRRGHGGFLSMGRLVRRVQRRRTPAGVRSRWSTPNTSSDAMASSTTSRDAASICP